MKIGHIELFVADVARSRDFYVDVLGFTEVETPSTNVAWIDAGPVELLLRPRPGGSASDAPTAASFAEAARGITLYTDDLSATRERLEARGLVFRGFDGSPGCPTFHDPDGHWFQLVDPQQHT